MTVVAQLLLLSNLLREIILGWGILRKLTHDILYPHAAESNFANPSARRVAFAPAWRLGGGERLLEASREKTTLGGTIPGASGDHLYCKR